MFFESGSSSSSSSSRSECTYDVFLSFRGEDTRNNFTDHLYTALVQAGINTFRDDDELPRGQEISSQLRKAIKESRISMVVFSKGYASSRWCLDELREILECKNRNEDQVVIPIFYDIDPSDVRNRKRSFAEAFERHEERFKEEIDKVNEWKEALSKAGNLCGWNLKDMANGHEAKFIRNIVQDVSNRLDREYLHVSQKQVGIDSRADQIISLLKMHIRSGVLVVGIHGMAGIGKTTVAKAVFNKVCHRFEGSCFLLNVKETSEQSNGWVQLLDQILGDILKTNIQKIRNIDRGINLIKERLRGKRVLFVIDDLDQLKPLDALVRERNLFAPGSRIIITTKNERLLTELEVDEMFRVKSMDQQESLQLFNWHAFRDAQPAEDFMELSYCIVNYCGGLPLALEALGSSLFKRSKPEWENHIDQLRKSPLDKSPHSQILEKLKISFNTLCIDIQNMFLDIACFFIGMKKEYAAEILDARFDGLNIEIGFNTLIERCLLTINYENELRMHDLLRDMGREIVRQMSPQHAGERSRIWLHKDSWNVLEKQSGTKNVQGLALDLRASEAMRLSTESFTKMSYLQLLLINGVDLIGSFEHLSKELIWLCWFGCPLKFLPPNFQLNNLVVLDMQHSKVKEIRMGTESLNKLKILNLSYSECFTKTPNLRCPSLQKLILEGCSRLVEVHQSIGNLKNLVLLNLRRCCRLKKLPESMGDLKSLETLNIEECSILEKLPERLGNMESVAVLLADETSIKQLPSSIGNLKNLRLLSLAGRKYNQDLPYTSWLSWILLWLSPSTSDSLVLFPASFFRLSSLRELNLRNCGLSEGLISSTDFGGMSSLVKLNLSKNKFFNMPSGIDRLSKLKILMVNGCTNLLSIPELPSSLRKLYARDCKLMEKVSVAPKTSARLTVGGCPNLKEIEGMEGVGYTWDISLAGSNNLSNNCRRSIVQALCKKVAYTIILGGGEIPEWFSHHGEGSSVLFKVPNPISDGILRGLLVYVATLKKRIDYCGFNIRIARNGFQLLERIISPFLSSLVDRTKRCWLIRVTLRTEHLDLCGIEAGDELELSVELNNQKNSSEALKCGVYMIVEKSNDSQGSAADAHWKSCLIRELQQSQIKSISSRKPNKRARGCEILYG